MILDWVPGHFPDDPHGLARFDGTGLYEHEDPRQGRHLDWGTLIYNYGRVEVVNFLVSNALFWLERYGIDGLRVDAVASMLYLDYSRPSNAWIPNKHGGRENIEAIDFLRRTNTEVFRQFPNATTAAEESTAWPQVSRPVDWGGLGFGYKWNMGWMNDTLDYMSKDPIHRRHHHGKMLFGLHYAFSENFILPLSHDEVVHGKRSILGRMPGDPWQRFANLRAYYSFMFGHPGKKLMFMGCEFGQDTEWNHDTSLPWHLLDRPEHAGIQRLVRDLNKLYRDTPALHALDCDPAGFEWLVTDDADNCDLRLAAQGQRARRALRRGGEFHAAGIARLPASRALCRALARGLQFGFRRHMAAAMLGTQGRSPPLPCLTVRSSMLLSHRLLPSFSFLSSNGKISGGAALSARRQLGRTRHQLRAVLGQCDEGRTVPVRPRRPARDRTRHVAGAHRRRLACLSAACGAGPALRLPRARSLRTRCRASVQCQQAADRSLQQTARRPVRLERRAFRLSHRQQAAGSGDRQARQRPQHVQIGRRRSRAIRRGTRGVRRIAGKTRSSTRPMSKA